MTSLSEFRRPWRVVTFRTGSTMPPGGELVPIWGHEIRDTAGNIVCTLTGSGAEPDSAKADLIVAAVNTHA